MKKVAILVNEATMERCSCGGCLGAIFAKKDSFADYGDTELDLVTFTHSGGDIDKKIATMKKKGVEVVHLSSCTKTKNEDYYKELVEKLSNDFDVVGYTHGTREGKEREDLFISKRS